MDTTQNAKMQYHHYSWARLSIVLLLVLFVGLGGFLFILNKTPDSLVSSNNVKITDQRELSPTVTMPSKKGTIRLVTSKVSAVHTREAIPLIVKADSEDKNIVGFDILITYDPAYVNLTQVTPLDKRFQISSYTKRRGFISVTGTKPAANTGSTTLSNVDLLAITFTAVKQGNTEIIINPSVNKEKTKMIDINLKQLQPEVGSLKLEIL